jgi:8-oxo-dGTP pyrophosphatase MutT (NUDIX family)
VADDIASVLERYAALTDVERADLDRMRPIARRADAWSRATPLHVTASALVIDRTTQRVLLRWHARQHAWIQVGGHADPDEFDPLAIALREATEETGLSDLSAWPGTEGPIHVVVVPVPANDVEPAHEHADVRYVLATDRADDIRAETEGAAVRWLTFDDARGLTQEDNVRESLDRVERLISR